MSNPILSILIPTVDGREDLLNRLLCKLKNGKAWKEVIVNYPNCQNHALQKVDDSITILICKDNKLMSIGQKREFLYNQSPGLYSLQIDDDDDISENGIELILQSIKENPDCITYRENCMINGKYYSSNHSLKYDDWADNQDGFDYVRTPFYKDVIKTEIARSIPFEHIRYGEDHAWSRALKPHLKNEVHIDEEVYFYIHNSKPEEYNERYGIN